MSDRLPEQERFDWEVRIITAATALLGGRLTEGGLTPLIKAQASDIFQRDVLLTTSFIMGAVPYQYQHL